MKEIFSEGGKKATGRPRLPDDEVKPNTLYQRARREKLVAKVRTTRTVKERG
jgi:hypothetical protein